jgi:mannitol/fructose-specific phosphotransferase system IIA component (Ntr-type)
MAVEFRDWLGRMQVNLHLKARNQDAALREASELLRDHAAMIDIDKFQAELIAREQLSCTASDSGVAFPHARSEEGVLFNGRTERVHLLFVMGTPKDRIVDYLACVASLVRVLRKENVRKKLLLAKTAEAFIAEVLEAL